nr:MAG TPA: hypothetical protein [Caudoviricetes sp.]
MYCINIFLVIYRLFYLTSKTFFKKVFFYLVNMCLLV